MQQTIQKFRELRRRRRLSKKEIIFPNGNCAHLVDAPDGILAISTSDDNTLKVWDIESGQIIASFSMDGSLLTCTLSPEGVASFAGEESGRVHFLRLEGV